MKFSFAAAALALAAPVLASNSTVESGAELTTVEVTVTKPATTYLTTTFCELTETHQPTEVVKTVTSLITVTQGNRTVVTTTVCPLTETHPAVPTVVEVISTITVTKPAETVVSTTTCPVSEVSKIQQHSTQAPAHTPVPPVLVEEPSAPAQVSPSSTAIEQVNGAASVKVLGPLAALAAGAMLL